MSGDEAERDETQPTDSYAQTLRAEASDDGRDETGGAGLETRQMMAAVGGRLFGAEVNPARVGRFEVRGRLGSGGMGVVYRARDPGLGRDVAVKVIRSRRRGDDPRAAAQLRQEARSLARLAHPNVVTVLDVGTHRESLFVAMELVEGGTLHDWCTEHPPGTPGRIGELVRLLGEAAEGLAAAHRAGVVHRDIKPHNMLIGADGRLRLADFGLARSPDSSDDPDEVAGTPAYMAPEQLVGSTDSHSDQFSLCAAFWEAAYGVRPFEGSTLAALAVAISTKPPAAPSEVRDVPRWLRRLLERGLAKEPSARFVSMDALLGELRRRRRPRLALVSAAAGIAVLGVVVGTRTSGPCGAPGSDLHDVWTDRARAEVERRIVDARPDAGPAAFAHIAGELDAYADGWGAQWRDACRAGAEAEQLDLRMHCLDRAERAFAVVVEFAAAELDARSIARMTSAVDALPDLSACADPERLASGPPLPTDPSERAELTRLEGELQRQALLKYIEPLDESRALLEDLYLRAKAIGHAPLMVDVALLLSEYLYDLEDSKLYDLLAEAEDTALESGLELRAVRIAMMQWEADRRLGGAAAAPRLRLEHAVSVAQRIDDGATREHALGLVAEAQAIQLQEDGKPVQALARIEQHLALMERLEGPEHLMVASALGGRGSILIDLGRYDEAERDLERALEIRRGYPEPSPAGVARIVTDLTRIAFEQGRGADAVEYARIVPTLVAETVGKEHPAYAGAIGNLAAARLTAGDREGAIEDGRRTLELMQRIHQDDAAELVFARMNLATMLPPGPERGRLLTEAYDLGLVHHGAHSYVYATSLRALAAHRLFQGRPEDALEGATEALSVFETLERRRNIVEALTTIAQALLALERHDDALAQSERLVEAARELYGEDGAKRAEAELVRAEVLEATGRSDEAKQALARAEHFASDDSPYADRIAALRAALAL